MNTIRRMTATNEIGRWILDSMKRNNLNCVEVAQMLHCTKQCVRNHITGTVTPSYIWIVAYCRIFGGDPEKIWEMV